VIGSILDACDEYGNWHLSIVTDAKGNGKSSTERRLHFLPFLNSNRDETFKEQD
jgi:hypothetical protein